jgi:protein-histidine pros-kinase
VGQVVRGPAYAFVEPLEPVDCRRLAEEVVQSLQPLAAAKRLVLAVEPPGDAPEMAVADRRVLSQILVNLVNNAIKFTDAGGVRICLSRAPGGAVRIAVRDTGPGIPGADLSRIFHAYERSATTAKASCGGTGLGLHISQKLAGLLGATLTVTSTVGVGSTFTVSLTARAETPRLVSTSAHADTR